MVWLFCCPAAAAASWAHFPRPALAKRHKKGTKQQCLLWRPIWRTKHIADPRRPKYKKAAELLYCVILSFWILCVYNMEQQKSITLLQQLPAAKLRNSWKKD